MLNWPVTFSRSPSEIRTGAPEFGQHTEDILVEELGYTWDDVAAVRDKQVI